MNDSQPRSLAGQAYERIRSMIADGQLPPNIVIRETDLVRHHRFTRSPMREALQRLHAEGLIRQVPGGYIALDLGADELRDIYEVRTALVGLAAELAARRRTRADLGRLQDALEAIDSACEKGDDDEADAQVRTFYYALSAATGNQFLNRTLARITELFRYKALAVTHPEWRNVIRNDHLRVVDAIARRNAEDAGRIARELMAKSLAIRIQSLSRRQEAGA